MTHCANTREAVWRLWFIASSQLVNPKWLKSNSLVQVPILTWQNSEFGRGFVGRALAARSQQWRGTGIWKSSLGAPWSKSCAWGRELFLIWRSCILPCCLTRLQCSWVEFLILGVCLEVSSFVFFTSILKRFRTKADGILSLAELTSSKHLQFNCYLNSVGILLLSGHFKKLLESGLDWQSLKIQNSCK